jgi:hypothetical protein
MIKHTKSNIETAYKGLIGDEIVYNSAKGMDDTIVSLVDGIANPLIEKNKYTKSAADAVKDNLRTYFDKTVAKKLNDNLYKAYDSDGKRDNLKYAQVVAESIQAALTDKDFVAGYQAVATHFALRSLLSDVYDSFKDSRKAFLDGIDPKFQADFAAKYTNLVDDYIDTLATAALKAANNDAAYAAFDVALIPIKANYDANVAGAETTRTAAYNTAKNTRDTAIANAETQVVNAKQTRANDYAQLQVMIAAGTYTDAQIANQKALVAADDANISAAEAALVATTTTANTQYDKDIAKADKAYTATIKASDAIYDAQVLMPELKLEQALEEINPWAWSTEMVDGGIPVGSPWD